jgi:hypothetical protein
MTLVGLLEQLSPLQKVSTAPKEGVLTYTKRPPSETQVHVWVFLTVY